MAELWVIVQQIASIVFPFLTIWLAISKFKSDKKLSNSIARESDSNRIALESQKELESIKQSNQWASLGYNTVLKALEDNTQSITRAQEEHEKQTARFELDMWQLLKRALCSCDAVRILVFIFHNGERDTQGLSFKRMSCNAEVMDVGMSPIQNNYRDLFRNQFYYIYEQLNAGKCVSIFDMETIRSIDPSLYDTMSQDGIKAIFVSPIKNGRDSTFAFVAYCYDKVQTDGEIINLVKGTAARLEGLYLRKPIDKQKENVE